MRNPGGVACPAVGRGRETPQQSPQPGPPPTNQSTGAPSPSSQQPSQQPPASQPAAPNLPTDLPGELPEGPIPPLSPIASYAGRVVGEIRFPKLPERERPHLLDLIPQKQGQPLDRDHIRDGIVARTTPDCSPTFKSKPTICPAIKWRSPSSRWPIFSSGLSA